MTIAQKASTPEYLLFVVRETLTDGSHVYNVKFGEFSFPAVDEDEAMEFADKIVDAINDHTTQTADKVVEF